MRDVIQTRIDDLKANFEEGRTRLAAIEREAAQLRETMLRISGAVQVLEEVLAAEEADEPARNAAE